MERERRIRDQARRTHPKSNSDFAVLYNELDSWRQAEVAKIKVTLLNYCLKQYGYHKLFFDYLFSPTFLILKSDSWP
jgi:hypothetical protein